MPFLIESVDLWWLLPWIKATMFYTFFGCNACDRGLIVGVFAQKYDFLQVCTYEPLMLVTFKKVETYNVKPLAMHYIVYMISLN